jgi:4-amino-4-deoxy-L-arabinose transferase-like glycosyltransferase
MSARLPIPAWIAVLATLLALAFLGSRPIWDPDEGRYTNVALTMLDSGDWLNPRRNHETGHWTKPPVTYWLIAAGVGGFGRSAWAARLPIALSFLACAFMAWRIARRLAPGSEATAALAFATMLLPFGASQFVSTDFPLAALQTLAMWSYVEARFGDPPRAARWLTSMWAGFALAFLTKGPPALLPLVAVLAHEWLVPSRRTTPVLRWTQALVFVLLALPWYVAVIRGHPGLLAYFLGAEVVERFASEAFNRHAEWYGWAKVYLPTLLLGTLPWTPALWRWARTLPAGLRRWRGRRARGEDAAGVLLALWIVLPLLVFCLARSRMPLYLLPLFVPLAVVVARQRHGEGRPLPPWRSIAPWAAVLLGLKLAAAHWPTHKDASAWAREIRARAPFAVTEVVFVEDMARYGLNLYLDADIEKVSLAPVPGARFNPTFDQDLASELAEHESGVVYVARQQDWAAVRASIEALGYRACLLGAPYRERMIFRVAPASP